MLEVIKQENPARGGEKGFVLNGAGPFSFTTI